MRVPTLALSLLLLGFPPFARAQEAAYQARSAAPDGIGKVWLGREIAQVMGHEGADWLERPERVGEEKTDLLMAELRRRLRPEATVADIGAGTGYFTFRLAPLVPRGRVLAVDIQPEMLRLIQYRGRKLGLANVEPILGTIADPKLPAASTDFVLLVDAYHEFSHPREMMAGIVRGLKKGGQVWLVEYRGEDPEVPIKPLHKMTEAQARREMEAAGLAWRETKGFLPQQHFMVFEKP